MSGPIYGGNDPLQGLNDTGATTKGVYATFPAATPKYNAGNHLESRDTTQARLYIEIPDPAAFQTFLDAVPPEARKYAEAMTRTSDSVGGKGYVDFFLTATNEPLKEKVQVSEVLSDTHVAYYFGQSAPVWSYQIGLINSQQDEWYDAWNIIYENIIRGTRLAERKVSVTLSYDTRLVTGSIMQSQTAMNAQNELAVTGGFSLLVKELQIATRVTEETTDFLVGAAAIPGLTQEIEEQTKQSESKAVDKVSREREKDQGPAVIGAAAAGVRQGFNPDEVEEKTGTVIDLSDLAVEQLEDAGILAGLRTTAFGLGAATRVPTRQIRTAKRRVLELQGSAQNAVHAVTTLTNEGSRRLGGELGRPAGEVGAAVNNLDQQRRDVEQSARDKLEELVTKIPKVQL